MTKAPMGSRVSGISLQDLRRRMYAKAKAEKTWRFWGLYVHVCKMETLRSAYRLAKANNGAPGIDGVTFKEIEKRGAEEFLKQICAELLLKTYRPLPNRRKEIPKGNGKVRVLGIPTIRDRVVQGALTLILEPIFEADFQDGSFGYRPRRSAHQAIARVDEAIWRQKTKVIDVDLKGYFDNVRHHILMEKMARRVSDPDILHLLKMILRASGKKGVPQGGVISPLLSNLYLNEVDKMLERAKEVTRAGRYTHVEYARYADDMAILVDNVPRHAWLAEAVNRRLREELAKIQVAVNEEKSRVVDLAKGESFAFLGFEFRRVRSLRGTWRPNREPTRKSRTALFRELRETFRHSRSQPIRRVIEEVNPKLAGWVNYFRVGNSAHCFDGVRQWVERKIRRQMMQARQRKGFGWKRWDSRYVYRGLGLYADYRIRYLPRQAALPVHRSHNPGCEPARRA